MPDPQPQGGDAQALAERRAPVQGFSAGIPWSMHLRAYDAYCKKWSPQQALIEGGCRGGFGVKELDDFIPGWREELSEIKALKDALRTLQAESELRLREWENAYREHRTLLEQARTKDARIAALEKALDDVLPYAIASIGHPRSLWPADSVILRAEKLLAGVTPGVEQPAIGDAPPEPPWPIGPATNCKRTGWTAFFEGRHREACPFPSGRADLQRGYREGWDAAAARVTPGVEQP